jgi:hypothetical protein
MKKSDKKIENNLVKSLTAVCTELLDQAQGFTWLTHTVNYADFPRSLRVICVFNTRDELLAVKNSEQYTDILRLVKASLASVSIPMNDASKQVVFDCEEACTKQHNGRWAQRLNDTVR